MADDKKTTDVKSLFAACAENSDVHALPTYRRYLVRMLKGSHPYAIYERFRAVFTPTLWIARVLRMVHRVLLVIETSAFLLVAAAFLLVLLPVLLLLALAFFHAALRERRRMNRRLSPRISHQRVVVLFGGATVAASLAAQYTVLRVTDSLPTRHVAAVAFLAQDGTILVREHYFFYLRRTLLPQASRVALLF